MISSTIDNLTDASLNALKTANKLRRHSLRTNGTWGEALGARALYIAQVVVSIVSVPLSLLAAIFAPAFALCLESKDQAYKLLKRLPLLSVLHLSIIPTALIAAFVPHNLKCEFPTKNLVECLNN